MFVLKCPCFTFSFEGYISRLSVLSFSILKMFFSCFLAFIVLVVSQSLFYCCFIEGNISCFLTAFMIFLFILLLFFCDISRCGLDLYLCWPVFQVTTPIFCYALLCLIWCLPIYWILTFKFCVFKLQTFHLFLFSWIEFLESHQRFYSLVKSQAFYLSCASF